VQPHLLLAPSFVIPLPPSHGAQTLECTKQKSWTFILYYSLTDIYRYINKTETNISANIKTYFYIFPTQLITNSSIMWTANFPSKDLTWLSLHYNTKQSIWNYSMIIWGLHANHWPTQLEETDISPVKLLLGLFVEPKPKEYTLQFIFNLNPVHHWTANALCAKPLINLQAPCCCKAWLGLKILPKSSSNTLHSRLGFHLSGFEIQIWN
jgi:hypothetical protein